MANRLAVIVSLLFTISGCASQMPTSSEKGARPAKLIDQAKTKMERELIERIDEIRRGSQIPGLQIIVDQQGTQVLNLALGIRAAHLPESFVTPRDVWHLGSNTKPMTAFLIGQAIERSNLTWHTQIAQALKSHSFPLHQSVKFITIDQLLSHQAGLTEPVSILGGKLWAAVFRDDEPIAKMRSALAKGILSTPTKFAPGTRT
ncbi:MAG: serine hydrolase domain-containing protein, partial [Bdellovibrionales bacterium]|nr:serine hydrolase domain-containing protein [Bdellovibrionales bacterium]